MQTPISRYMLLVLLASVSGSAMRAMGDSPAEQAGDRAGSKTQAKPSLIITRSGSQAAQSGPAEYFTGVARIDGRFQAADPARVSGAAVTFEPGARTAWHTHPLGQTLIVTAGVGWVQVEGGPVEEIRTGDIVWFPPNVKHWHGATPTSGMTHIAIAEKLDGKSVEWMEKVTDAQYRKQPPTEKQDE